jgi:hypothetical protein
LPMRSANVVPRICRRVSVDVAIVESSIRFHKCRDVIRF